MLTSVITLWQAVSSDVSLGVIASGDLIKCNVPSIKLRISLGLNIHGSIWENVVQPNKIYIKDLEVYRNVIAYILYIISLKQKKKNFRPPSIYFWHQCCKDNQSVSVFLKVTVTRQNMSLLTHLVYIGASQPSLSSGHFVHSEGYRNQSKHQWCRYSDAVTLCNRHLFYHHTLNEKACICILSMKKNYETLLSYRDLFSFKQ